MHVRRWRWHRGQMQGFFQKKRHFIEFNLRDEMALFVCNTWSAHPPSPWTSDISSPYTRLELFTILPPRYVLSKILSSKYSVPHSSMSRMAALRSCLLLAGTVPMWWNFFWKPALTLRPKMRWAQMLQCYQTRIWREKRVFLAVQMQCCVYSSILPYGSRCDPTSAYIFQLIDYGTL